jgi:hypothetical protein
VSGSRLRIILDPSAKPPPPILVLVLLLAAHFIEVYYIWKKSSFTPVTH